MARGALKLVPIEKEVDLIITANARGSIASLVANGVYIYSDHDRILRMKRLA
jgi:hypothetical protein